MDRFIVISGCSGGGKSTLLAELAHRGFSTIEEPGRRIVAEEQASGGGALPWSDPEAFLKRAVDLSLEDIQRAEALPGRIFFDRGLFDAASGLAALTGETWLERLALRGRFHPLVFLTPPWPEIYETDADRKHGLEAALEEYERLGRDYPAQGYTIVELPKVSVGERADLVVAVIEG